MQGLVIRKKWEGRGVASNAFGELKNTSLTQKNRSFLSEMFHPKKFLNCNYGSELLVTYGNLYFEYIELKKLFFFIYVCMRFLIFPPDFGFIHIFCE